MLYVCVFVLYYGRTAVAEYCNYKSNQVNQISTLYRFLQFRREMPPTAIACDMVVTMLVTTCTVLTSCY